MSLLQDRLIALNRVAWLRRKPSAKKRARSVDRQVINRLKILAMRPLICSIGYATRGAVPGLMLTLLWTGISGAAAQKNDAQDAIPTCFAQSSSQDGNSTAGDYRLSPGDQARVLVYQREDLSGTYQIGDNGMISLPSLGRLPAAGSTLHALEKSVAETIEHSTGRTENVIIEILARRPIYIVGLVNNPGAYLFAADMTVLHAVALGGGLYRPNERAGGLIGASRESGQLNQSVLRLKQALALHARLQAERDAETVLEPPKQLVALEGEDGAQQYMNRQLRIMEIRAEARKMDELNTVSAAGFAKQEIKNLKEQVSLSADQLKLAAGELEAINTLKQKGLLRRSDLFTIQRVIANLEADRRAVQARISRAQFNLLQTEARLQLLGINQKLAIEQELNQAKFDIASNESAIQESQWIVGELISAAQQEDNKGLKSITIEYQIIRTVDKVRYKLAATELTALCPGDIVRLRPANIP